MAVRNLLTAKQETVLYSYLHDDWKFLILAGAKRSGKTYIDNFIFIYEIRRVAALAKQREDPHPQYILGGFSSKTIYTNVISSIASQFGLDLHPDRHGNYHLFGVEIVPSYTGSLRGMASIRGMTSYGAYVNEGSLSVEDVFQEIVARCSVESARIIADTNPDQPNHWLKVNYIDNDNPALRCRTFHFTIDDNTTLSADYVSAFKAATPSGMFYDRDIRGLWVTGEGIVYQDFDKNRMVIPQSSIPDGLRVYCGVDWGFKHKGVITVWGDDDDGNVYLLHEYTAQYKFISYWVNLAKQLQDRYGHNLVFWADSARPDNVTEFQKAGINCRNANKSKMAGIEKVAEFMKRGQFFVNEDGVDQFLDEIYQYVWDENTGEPRKEQDDVMDSMRYAIFNAHRENHTQFLDSKYF